MSSARSHYNLPPAPAVLGAAQAPPRLPGIVGPAELLDRAQRDPGGLFGLTRHRPGRLSLGPIAIGSNSLLLGPNFGRLRPSLRCTTLLIRLICALRRLVGASLGLVCHALCHPG